MTNSQRILCALVFIIGSLLLLRHWRKLTWHVMLVYGFAVVYVAFLIRHPSKSARYVLDLFYTWKRLIGPGFRIRRGTLRIIVLNILLFVPCGYLVPILWRKVDRWWKMLLFGFAASLVIELLQLTTHLGMLDLDDLLNNTIGALLGWGCYRLILKKE